MVTTGDKQARVGTNASRASPEQSRRGQAEQSSPQRLGPSLQRPRNTTFHSSFRVRCWSSPLLFSGMAELIWDGKYDEHGNKRAPVRIELPFQTVETVNESVQERQRTLELSSSGNDPEWRNRLIWGDKKYVLPSLLPEFAGKVDLIYIDPPFDTGADFSFSAQVPAFEENGDTEGEEVSFLKEPVWKRQSAHSDSHQCGAIHDTIFFYSRSETWVWNDILCEPGPDYIDSFFDQVETETGRRYARGDLTGAGVTKSGLSGKPWRGINPSTWGRHWAVNPEELDRLDKEGRLHWPKKGMPRLKRYLNEFSGVPLQDIWTDIRIIHNQSPERVGYPTQKPEALLDRIIRACSKEGNLVLDCFAGSGTTSAVAEKLNRRWITCDLGRFAIHTTRKRLLSIDNVKPFVVQNLGKYERQAWQAAEFADPTQRANLQLRYRNFILQLYNATPIDGYSWIHGVKGGRLVHVGSVDAPIALGEVRAIVNEFWRVRGKDAGEHSNGIDIL